MDQIAASWDATHFLVSLMIELGLEPVEAEVASLRRDIGDLGEGTAGDLGNIVNRMTNIEKEISDLRRDFGDLGEGVGGDLGNVINRITSLENNYTTIQTRITNLENNLGAFPVAFVFGGVPAVRSTINVPITINMAIGVLSTSGSRYYNQVPPSSGTTRFILYRVPLGSTTATEIGRVTRGIGAAGAVTWQGNGHNALVAGDTLRMTADETGADLSDVSITIHATRR